MTQEEIKFRMVSGEWVDIDTDVTLYTLNEGNKLIARCDSDGFTPVQDQANAAAICHAVNNTYGISVNPEMIPAAIELIKKLSNMHLDANPCKLIEEANALMPLLKFN